MTPTGATRTIAEFATAARRGTSPTRDHVGRLLQDTVGVAVAGVASDVGLRLLDWVAAESAPGEAAVWGTPLTLAPSQAALVNGTTGHALDWDDAAPSMQMHPATVLLPALLAQSVVDDADGARLTAAYDVGSSVFRAVSEALPLGYHYGRGWHNTSSTGRLAATAAVAHLAGLGVDETRHALGIAASSVAGSLANFGTMTKPLHAGLAARDAVMAVGLARRGFTANPDQLEAPRGFFAAYGDSTPDLLATLPDRLAHWETAWVTDYAIKRHPSCFATHLPIDAAIELHEGGGGPSIERVDLHVPAASLAPLLDHLPRTGLEGKFSLPYTVARALTDGRVRLDDFTDERVASLRGLTERVAVHTSDGRPPSRVELTLADGTRRAAEAEVSYGDARRPLSEEDLDAKFADAVAAAGHAPADVRRLGADLRAGVVAPSVAGLGRVLTDTFR